MKTSRKIAGVFAALSIALSAVPAAQAADVSGTLSPSGLTFTENSASPAFTFTTPALSTSGSYTSMILSVSIPGNPPTNHWAVNTNCPSTETAAASCGISSVKVDNVSVTGVTARKIMNFIRLGFNTSTLTSISSGSTVSITVDSGTFTVGAAGTYSLMLEPMTSNPAADDRAVLSITSVASGGGGGTPTPSPAPAPNPAPAPAPQANTAATLAQTGTSTGSVAPIGVAFALLIAGGATVVLWRRRVQ